MYPDCLCINEFNYYGNTLQEYNCQAWDTKLASSFPMQQCDLLFSTGFESPQQPHLMSTTLSDSNSSHFAAAMSFCSSSSSSMVSSPSPTQHNACFMPHTIATLTSPDYIPQYSMPVNPLPNYASYMPHMNNLIYGNFPNQSMKPMKCTKTKIYDCNLCPRSFARKHDLQRHIRVHTGAKPYYCLNCEKSFARTDALKRHLRMEESCRMSPVIQALKNVGMRRYRNL